MRSAAPPPAPWHPTQRSAMMPVRGSAAACAPRLAPGPPPSSSPPRARPPNARFAQRCQRKRRLAARHQSYCGGLAWTPPARHSSAAARRPPGLSLPAGRAALPAPSPFAPPSAASPGPASRRPPPASPRRPSAPPGARPRPSARPPAPRGGRPRGACPPRARRRAASGDSPARPQLPPRRVRPRPQASAHYPQQRWPWPPSPTVYSQALRSACEEPRPRPPNFLPRLPQPQPSRRRHPRAREDRFGRPRRASPPAPFPQPLPPRPRVLM
mmetsp:Transcript_75170/g.189206  ORF Transcript_75170/g.189206 Transcript_75170/m.189206 type:complete len:270 (+) Transcript_75170:260-1069(+)